MPDGSARAPRDPQGGSKGLCWKRATRSHLRALQTPFPLPTTPFLTAPLPEECYSLFRLLFGYQLFLERVPVPLPAPTPPILLKFGQILSKFNPLG